jgi:exosome complex component RRP42
MAAVEISESEREFIAGGAHCGVRSDGRTATDQRPFHIQTGLIEQANGSARVRLGHSDILVGVKAEIVETVGAILFFLYFFSCVFGRLWQSQF